MGKKSKNEEQGFSVRFSAFKIAMDAIADDLLYYKLTNEEKLEGLNDLRNYVAEHASSLIDEEGVIKQETRFNPIASSYHPHLWSVRVGKSPTPQEVFSDPQKLTAAIEHYNRALHKRNKGEQEEDERGPAFLITTHLAPSATTAAVIRKACSLYRGTQRVSQFSPVAAAALYYMYLPKGGGAVWDPSMGWGGRMLGAWSCDRVTKYIGSDPSTDTFAGLQRMKRDLKRLMPDREIRIEPHKLGSETSAMRAKLKPRSVHLIMTSPPYWNREKYSDEETQSCVQYKTKEEWLEGFLGGTLDNCQRALKPGGHLIINIAGVPGFRDLPKQFVSLAETRGWRKVNELKLALSQGPGTKLKDQTHRHEPVFVFGR